MDMPRSTGVFLIVGGLLVALMTQRTLLSGRQSMSAPGVIETPVEGNSGVREAPGLLEVLPHHRLRDLLARRQRP